MVSRRLEQAAWSWYNRAMQTDRDPFGSANRINSVTRRIAELRWPIVFIVIGVAAVHQAVLFGLLHLFPPQQQNLVQLALYSLTGVIVVWFGLRLLLKTTARQEQAEVDLRDAYAELELTHRQLQTIHEVGQRVTNSSDVHELMDIAVRIPVELLGAASSSVITFDSETDRGDLAMTYGLSEPGVQALRQEVSTTFSTQRCTDCQPLTAHVNNSCHLLELLQASGNSQGIDRIVCMPLGRGQERTGIVSAYLGPGASPSAEQIRLVSILATEISSAMETTQLRERQMATLYAVDQATQERRSLDTLLVRVLYSTASGWGVQAGAILLSEGNSWDVRVHQGMGGDLAAPAFGQALRMAERADDWR